MLRLDGLREEVLVELDLPVCLLLVLLFLAFPLAAEVALPRPAAPWSFGWRRELLRRREGDRDDVVVVRLLDWERERERRRRGDVLLLLVLLLSVLRRLVRGLLLLRVRGDRVEPLADEFFCKVATVSDSFFNC